jgi:hypothetical protein
MDKISPKAFFGQRTSCFRKQKHPQTRNAKTPQNKKNSERKREPTRGIKPTQRKTTKREEQEGKRADTEVKERPQERETRRC